MPTRTDSWPRAKGKGRGTAWEPALAISRKHPGGIKRRMSRRAFRPAGRNEIEARIGKQKRDGKDFPHRTAPARFAQGRGCRAGRRRRSRACCFFFDLRKAGAAERAAGAGHERAAFSLTSIKRVSFLLILSDFLTRCRPGTGRFLPPPALCGKMLPCEALKVRLEKPQKPTA